MAKNLGVPPDYVLNEMSYENLIMYGNATPTFDSDKKEDDWDDSLDANNPANFSQESEEEIVR